MRAYIDDRLATALEEIRQMVAIDMAVAPQAAEQVEARLTSATMSLRSELQSTVAAAEGKFAGVHSSRIRRVCLRAKPNLLKSKVVQLSVKESPAFKFVGVKI